MMPLPLILAGGAAAVALYGAYKGAKAVKDFGNAKDTNRSAHSVFDEATESLALCRDRAQKQLTKLGERKVALYEDTLTKFIDTFSRLKNVDVDALDVPDEFIADIADEILRIHETTVQMSEAAGGGAGALGAGALAGLAAYGSVGLLGTASTGTAIAGLSGAAATNATLAWLGGGSLAAGGMGIAGGTAVLGGIVAAPVLLVGGLLLASKATQAKENASSNLTKARNAAKAMKTAEAATRAIGRVAGQTQDVLRKLRTLLDGDMWRLQRVIEHNDDYVTYSPLDKELVARVVSLAITAKNVAETPLLEADGAVATAIKAELRKTKTLLRHLEAM